MYDIVFISYEELNAEDHFNRLNNKFNRSVRLKRIHGVRGIHAAHKIAAKTVDTEMFYVVDGDALIVDDFNFNYDVPDDHKNDTHVFRAKNPINDLVYGYGAVKLFPTEAVKNMDLNNIKTDMSSSLSNTAYRVVQQLSNITAFNTDPYNTWRSAFRECAKLSSKIIDNQKDDETEARLDAWCTLGADRLNGIWSIKGAKAGKSFGKIYASQPEKLMYINNMEWLKIKFDEARI
jgi:hypothetical protein